MIIFLAELGDKTGLLVIALSSKTGKTKSVIIGAMLGLFFMTIMGIIAGSLLTQLVSNMYLVHLIGATIFVIIGVYLIYKSLRKDSEEKKEEDNPSGKSISEYSHWKVIFLSLIAIGSAEFLDKTQFAVVTLTIEFGWINTLIGSMLGFFLITFLEAILGNKLSEKLPEKYVDRFAGMLFVLAAVFMVLF